MPQTVAALLGIKWSTAVAGLVGSISALAYMRNLTLWGAATAVLVGTSCAVYMTPVVVEWLALSPDMENGASFLIGITGMHTAGGMLAVAEKFRHDPVGFLKSVFHRK